MKRVLILKEVKIERSLENQKQRLREMARLGKLGTLTLGQPTPAFAGKNNIIEGYPIIPEAFKKLKEIIPESDWWWISSGTSTHNQQGRTQGVGSFEFRFTSKSYFYFKCSYDPMIGFTKIKIGYDDLDTDVTNPNQITIEEIETIINYDYEKMLNFLLDSCDLNDVQKENVKNTLDNQGT